MTAKKTKGIDLFANQEKLPVNVDEIAAGTGVGSLLMDRATIDAIIAHVKNEAMSEVCDGDTVDGRKRMISISAAVSSSKTLFKKPMEDKIRDVKLQPKIMTENKNHLLNSLDAIRDLRRKPADEWQAEQDCIAQAKQDVIDSFAAVVVNAKEQLPNMSAENQVEQIKLRITDTEAVDTSPALERVEEAEAAKKDCLVTLAGYLSYAEKELAKAQQAQAEHEERIREQARQDAIKANADQLRQSELDKDAAERRAKQERENAEERAKIAAQKAVDDEREKVRNEEVQRVVSEAKQQAVKAEGPSKEHISAVNTATGTALCELGLTVEQAKAVMSAAKAGKLHGLKLVY